MTEVKWDFIEIYVLKFNKKYSEPFTSVDNIFSNREIGWTDGIVTIVHKDVTKIAYMGNNIPISNVFPVHPNHFFMKQYKQKINNGK